MKKYAVLLLWLSGCATIGTVSEVNINRDFPHNEIQKIAVFILETPSHHQDKEENNSGFSKIIVRPDAGRVLADIIARELAKWERYVVLDRRALEEELKLITPDKEDILHNENYFSLGKSLGIDAVVVGNVEGFGISYKTFSGLVVSLNARVSFFAKCIDVTTNEVIWSIKADKTSKEDNEISLASKLVAKTVSMLKAKMK
jgi:hypothetical protein